MLGRASSNALIAASPLLTSTISKLPSAKVCVTSRRIVGLSSAIRIFGFIPLEFLQRPRYQKRADWVRPFSWSPIPLLAAEEGNASAEFLCRRLARLHYFGVDLEFTRRISTAGCAPSDAGWCGVLLCLSGRRGGSRFSRNRRPMPDQTEHFADNASFVTRGSLRASQSNWICLRNGHVHSSQAVFCFFNAVRKRMIRNNAGIVDSSLWCVVACAQRLRQIVKRILHFRIVRILGHDFLITGNRSRIRFPEVVKIRDPVHTLGKHFLDCPQFLLRLVKQGAVGIVLDHRLQFRFG